MNNCIFSILVYRHQGMWVFDDDRVNLVKEPFVAGADTFLDILAQHKDQITLIFSDQDFPTRKLILFKDNDQGNVGTNYYSHEYNHKLWLCPALNLYYPISPERIYVDYKTTNQ